MKIDDFHNQRGPQKSRPATTAPYAIPASPPTHTAGYPSPRGHVPVPVRVRSRGEVGREAGRSSPPRWLIHLQLQLVVPSAVTVACHLLQTIGR